MEKRIFEQGIITQAICLQDWATVMDKEEDQCHHT
uniref:Uncharacterized protein n=1 Tax=Arundo donax TaxID=35708 RepID=A0A0A9BBC6_ARUDO